MVSSDKKSCHFYLVPLHLQQKKQTEHETFCQGEEKVQKPKVQDFLYPEDILWTPSDTTCRSHSLIFCCGNHVKSQKNTATILLLTSDKKFHPTV